MLPDGRLTAVGQGTVASMGQPLVARFLPNGDLDNAFDQDGRILFSLPGVAGGGLFGVASQPDGKVVASGTLKISLDPQRGQLRSWHFDDDGGHGQALWLRDGNNWVLDSIGVLSDGTETASVSLLGRLNPDEVTWRSIDRVAGDRPVPDTVPVKLTRVAGTK